MRPIEDGLTGRIVRRGAALFTAITTLLAASCSLTTVSQTDCETSAECVEALGDGHLCGSAGYCILSANACASDSDCRERNGFASSCGTGGECVDLEPTARCTKTYPEKLFTRSDRADYVVIGNLMDRSVTTHQARENSAELAFRQANAEGGIDGKKFGIVFCTIEENADFDSLERTDAAVASAEWLVNTLGVPAIVGPAASSDTGAVFSAIRDSKTVVISPSATSPALTAQDNTSPTDKDPGFLWRTAPPDSLQGEIIAADMKARGVTKVTVVNETGAYGDELARVFQEEFGAADIKVFSSDTQIADLAVDVASSDTEEVLFVSSQTSDGVKFLNAAASTGADFDGKQIFLTDSAANADLIDSGAEALFARVRGTRPKAVSGPVYSAFQASYAAEFKDDVSQFSFTAQAYDAAWLVLYGAAWSYLQDESVSGLQIARGIRRTSSPSGIDVEIRGPQWQSVVQAFREKKRVNVTGASGELDFNLKTEETTAPIEVWRISDDCSGGFEIEVLDVGATPPPVMCN